MQALPQQLIANNLGRRTTSGELFMFEHTVFSGKGVSFLLNSTSLISFVAFASIMCVSAVHVGNFGFAGLHGFQ